MISARNFYQIGDIFNRVYNHHSHGGFGRLNVVLFFDFRQLPPPNTGGPPLYTLEFKSLNEKLRLQDEAGQLMFSQFLLVVVLRQCMRTKGPYLHMLNQMCVGACDAESIALFRTCIIGDSRCSVSLKEAGFWPVSIITTRNKKRDDINSMGEAQFSILGGEALTTLCSLDICIDSQKAKKFLPASIQAAVWKLSPADTDHIPGLLKLCRGLPILIKRNLSVGSGVTNGAEGTVISWTMTEHPHFQGMQVANVIYAKLLGKYSDVVFDEILGPGIVPLVPVENYITVNVPDFGKIRILRRMHQILPNFSMSDFASQGKGRKYNIFWGEQIDRIQSLYTMASRSTDPSTTAILGHVNLQLLT
ncbi:hypothetical protein BCR33DRAFT_661522, partial [Rhizoclosmatium globosum]